MINKTILIYIFIILFIIFAFGLGFYLRSKLWPFQESINKSKPEVTIPVDIKVSLEKMAEASGKPCYKNLQFRIQEISSLNQKFEGIQALQGEGEFESNTITLKSVIANDNQQESCRVEKDLVRLIDRNGSVHLSEIGPLYELPSKASLQPTFRFSLPFAFDDIKVVIGSPKNPDGVYKVDFKKAAVAATTLFPGELPYLFLRSPNGGENLCIGKDAAIEWEHSGQKTVTITLRQSGSASYNLGTFPADYNEAGKKGEGIFVWRVGETKQGQTRRNIEEGSAYEIYITSRNDKAQQAIFQDTSDDLFQILQCEG